MTKEQAKQRVNNLKKLIEKYRYAYHVLDKPLVSDAINDSLKHELQELEDRFPEFVTPDSPTQRVGGKPLAKFQRVTHSAPMLSLTDAFDEQEVLDWQKRNQKIVSGDFGYFCELKMDGLAVTLIYENGIFVRGATRGDGRVGEDVTQNLRTIESIPLQLTTNNQRLTTKIEVRGEIFMNAKTFEALNKEQEKKGLAKFANPRNAAAGSVRQLDSKITAGRKLSFFAYDLVTDLNQRTHQEVHQIVKSLGFSVNPYSKYCQNIDEVVKYQQKWQKEREKLPYWVDGVVVVVNNLGVFKKLGVVGKAPRAMIALKFPPEETTSVVEDIIVQVGRTGVLTPVAVFKPTLIAGSMVSRATLHNEDEIKRKDVRIGDTIVIHKAGDVIPEVERAIKDLRTGKEKVFKMPHYCPICNGQIVRKNNEVAYRCADKKCLDKNVKRYTHFVSRTAFDIEGLGIKILEKFIELRLIKDPADIFDLKEKDIAELERFGEKSASNIISSIQSHKKVSLGRFIYALGIRNVGEETAHDLAKNFGSLEKIKKSSLDDIRSVYDIGPIVAQSVYEYFHDSKDVAFVEKLLKVGLEIESQTSNLKSQTLRGKTFLFTGSLETITRDDAKEKVRSSGGNVAESASKNVDFVVVGSEPGSKYERAKKLGIKIIDEKKFIKLIKE